MSLEKEETEALSVHVRMQREERRPSPRKPIGHCEKYISVVLLHCVWHFIIGGQTEFSGISQSYLKHVIYTVI